MRHQAPDCRVYVGSLKAGGTGIDLVAGSMVIHYDICFFHRFSALVSKESGFFSGRLSTISSKSPIKLYLRE
jgi:hypothetical protein